ncbi:hypothetical protein HNV12_01435 [Methanococcoides sp. SA1]|nr:hypothetical protein [Methanococcoides sp. SA1]
MTENKPKKQCDDENCNCPDNTKEKQTNDTGCNREDGGKCCGKHKHPSSGAD